MTDRLARLSRYAALFTGLSLAGLGPGLRAAPIQPGTVETAKPSCDVSLTGPIGAKWSALGGREGRLGCPTGLPAAAAPSPGGSTGEQVTFAGASGGTILRQITGPHAGQTFVVSGCAFRLYFQFGGPGGWLGFPTSDAANIPDGQRQSFEGGEIISERASDSCSASRAAEIPSIPTPDVAESRLDLFVDDAGHNFALATTASAARAKVDHYRPDLVLGYVFLREAAGLIPLKTFWNPATGDHDTLASPDTERADLAAGYQFDGLQGFVWADPRPGALALKRFWNPASKASLLTSTPAAEADAAARGYAFVRVEGYVLATP